MRFHFWNLKLGALNFMWRKAFSLNFLQSSKGTKVQIGRDIKTRSTPKAKVLYFKGFRQGVEGNCSRLWILLSSKRDSIFIVDFDAQWHNKILRILQRYIKPSIRNVVMTEDITLESANYENRIKHFSTRYVSPANLQSKQAK